MTTATAGAPLGGRPAAPASAGGGGRCAPTPASAAGRRRVSAEAAGSALFAGDDPAPARTMAPHGGAARLLRVIPDVPEKDCVVASPGATCGAARRVAPEERRRGGKATRGSARGRIDVVAQVGALTGRGGAGEVLAPCVDRLLRSVPAGGGRADACLRCQAPLITGPWSGSISDRWRRARRNRPRVRTHAAPSGLGHAAGCPIGFRPVSASRASSD